MVESGWRRGVGERFRRARAESDISREALARRADVTSREIYLLEVGSPTIASALLYRLIGLIGASSDEVLFGGELQQDPQAPHGRHLNAQERLVGCDPEFYPYRRIEESPK